MAFTKPTTTNYDPQAAAQHLAQKHHLLKQEFEKYDFPHFKLQTGINRIRVLPPINGTTWIIPFQVYTIPGSPEVVVPGTVNNTYQEDDIITRFRKWGYRKNNPHREHMYYTGQDKTKKIYLFPKPKMACWIIPVDPAELRTPDKFPCKILHGSGNNGERGKPGPLFQIWNLTQIRTLNEAGIAGKPKYGEIADPETGRTIIITKTKGLKNTDTSYQVTPVDQATPLQPLLDIIKEAGHPSPETSLSPIENILYIPESAELLKYLKRYLISLGHKTIFEDFLEQEGITVEPENTTPPPAQTQKPAQAPAAPPPPNFTTKEENDEDTTETDENALFPEKSAQKADTPAEQPTAAAAPDNTNNNQKFGVPIYPNMYEDINTLENCLKLHKRLSLTKSDPTIIQANKQKAETALDKLINHIWIGDHAKTHQNLMDWVNASIQDIG
jgi:hypothetical protein